MLTSKFFGGNRKVAEDFLELLEVLEKRAYEANPLSFRYVNLSSGLDGIVSVLVLEKSDEVGMLVFELRSEKTVSQFHAHKLGTVWFIKNAEGEALIRFSVRYWSIFYLAKGLPSSFDITHTVEEVLDALQRLQSQELETVAIPFLREAPGSMRGMKDYLRKKFGGIR